MTRGGTRPVRVIHAVAFDSDSGKYIRLEIGEVAQLKGGYQPVCSAKGGAERHITRNVHARRNSHSGSSVKLPSKANVASAYTAWLIFFHTYTDTKPSNHCRQSVQIRRIIMLFRLSNRMTLAHGQNFVTSNS